MKIMFGNYGIQGGSNLVQIQLCPTFGVSLKTEADSVPIRYIKAIDHEACHGVPSNIMDIKRCRRVS